jgi:valyl-tRNA synthetase
VDVLVVASADGKASVERNAESIKSLARIGELTYADSIVESEKSKYLTAHLSGIDLYIEVAGLIDVEKELARIDSELQSIEKELARSEGKLSNEQFVSKAPPAIIEKERRIASELAEKKAKLLDRKQALAGY